MVLLGRDDRSVRMLVPDPRVNDRGFHEVTLVDNGPHGRAGCVSRRPVCAPAAVASIDSLSWSQQEHEHLRIESKKRYRNTRVAGVLVLREMD